MTPHRITIAQCPRRSNGRFNPNYAVRFEGELILSESREPLFDACRVLHARGLSGPVEMWDDTRPFPRMRTTIESGARLTVKETGTGPRFVKWHASVLDAPYTGNDGSEALEAA